MHIFLYGTLRDPAANPVAAALHRLLEPGTPASVAGALYAIPDPAGWYPALLPGIGRGRVHGVVCTCTARFTPADLARLDAYEDCRSDDPAGSEYRRGPVVADLAPAGHPVEAMAYCYARPLPADAVVLPDGDFAAWLAATGHAPFTPAA